jgi:hypothetical protein
LLRLEIIYCAKKICTALHFGTILQNFDTFVHLDSISASNTDSTDTGIPVLPEFFWYQNTGIKIGFGYKCEIEPFSEISGFLG